MALYHYFNQFIPLKEFANFDLLVLFILFTLAINYRFGLNFCFKKPQNQFSESKQGLDSGYYSQASSACINPADSGALQSFFDLLSESW